MNLSAGRLSTPAALLLFEGIDIRYNFANLWVGSLFPCVIVFSHPLQEMELDVIRCRTGMKYYLRLLSSSTYEFLHDAFYGNDIVIICPIDCLLTSVIANSFLSKVSSAPFRSRDKSLHFPTLLYSVSAFGS